MRLTSFKDFFIGLGKFISNFITAPFRKKQEVETVPNVTGGDILDRQERLAGRKETLKNIIETNPSAATNPTFKITQRLLKMHSKSLDAEYNRIRQNANGTNVTSAAGCPLLKYYTYTL